jgi:O-antigen/teichoic acid export membrane protein
VTIATAESKTTGGTSLRRLAILGSGAEIMGFGAAQVLRMAGNLVLTRMLSPDAFGLAALVTLTTQGLYMFSDVGIQPAVVRHERGNEPGFLNTAWTLQVGRGLVLGIITVILAWPLSVLYAEPRLTGLMLVGALGVTAFSLHSAALYSLRRSVNIAPLVALELGVQFVTLGIVIALAFALRSAWALVIGMAISSSLRTVASFWLPSSHRHAIHWDREVLRYMREFGKWIFLSTALTFISRQGDRLILGKLLGVSELGVYSVAVMLSEAMSELVTRVTHGVIFPLLSRVREEGSERLQMVYHRTRLALGALSLPILGAIAASGRFIVYFLFDSRYHEAGWMLELLAIRVAMLCTLTPCETCLNALGKSRYGFIQGLVRSIWIALFVPLGVHFGGLRGLVWVMAFSELPVFFVFWPAMKRSGLLRMGLEFTSLALFGLGYGLGAGVSALFGLTR